VIAVAAPIGCWPDAPRLHVGPPAACAPVESGAFDGLELRGARHSPTWDREVIATRL